jgi:hypothetical protein
MMHAYAYAMQMQCNYGAKHLRCYNLHPIKFQWLFALKKGSGQYCEINK